MRSSLRQCCEERRDKRLKMVRRLSTCIDPNTQKHKDLLEATDAMVHEMPLWMLPGISRRHARRFRANGVNCVPMVMVKLAEAKDRFCFRNWLVRMGGLENRETKLCEAGLKDWCKQRLCPPGDDDNND
ncbi:hypothetical protein LSAT2_013787, partial [Lamellibrachia satsuma]